MSTQTTTDKSGDTTAPVARKGGRLKKALLGILLAGIAIIAALAIVVAMQPDEFQVQRAETMAAPPEEVFALVNDFRNWNAWSPWAKLDPDAEYTFEGPPAGEGAVFAWSGNDQIGEGRMTITESRPPERVRYQLAFIRPMEDTADTEFAFARAGEGTQVTWTMTGENNFLDKAVCLFMDIDKMVGGDFEKGLANLKAIVEAEPSAPGEGATPPDGSNAHISEENK